MLSDGVTISNCFNVFFFFVEKHLTLKLGDKKFMNTRLKKDVCKDKKSLFIWEKKHA